MDGNNDIELSCEECVDFGERVVEWETANNFHAKRESMAALKDTYLSGYTGEVRGIAVTVDHQPGFFRHRGKYWVSVSFLDTDSVGVIGRALITRRKGDLFTRVESVYERAQRQVVKKTIAPAIEAVRRARAIL